MLFFFAGLIKVTFTLRATATVPWLFDEISNASSIRE
jgi:hypothetical protein